MRHRMLDASLQAGGPALARTRAERIAAIAAEAGVKPAPGPPPFASREASCATQWSRPKLDAIDTVLRGTPDWTRTCRSLMALTTGLWRESFAWTHRYPNRPRLMARRTARPMPGCRPARSGRRLYAAGYERGTHPGRPTRRNGSGHVSTPDSSPPPGARGPRRTRSRSSDIAVHTLLRGMGRRLTERLPERSRGSEE